MFVINILEIPDEVSISGELMVSEQESLVTVEPLVEKPAVNSEVELIVELTDVPDGVMILDQLEDTDGIY